MNVTLSHKVHVRLDENKSVYKMMLWCGKHIAPNYELWNCSPWDISMDEIVFQFVHAQDACEFSLTWS